MKNILIIVLLITVFGCQSQTELEDMTSELWKEDIMYLNRKIQREFESFLPEVKSQFASEIDQLLPKLVSMENYEISCEIMRLLSLLKDGHTELNVGHQNVQFHRVPLSVYFFQNDLRVLAAKQENETLIGSRIVKIGQFEINEAFGRLKNQMSNDNDMEYLHAGPGYLILTELLACLGVSESPTASTFTFELLTGELKTITFNGEDVETYVGGEWRTLHEINNVETPLYLSNRTSSYWHTFLSEKNVMYFNFARTNNQSGQPSIKKYVKALFEEIDEVKPDKLIIDFRLNNGGNYHLSRPLVEAIKERTWLNQKGKVWAITGRRTFSASTVACIFLKQETETQLIGEPGRTHPNWSDNNEYMNLPNSNFLIEYTTKIKKHWPERPELDRVPVDVAIEPDFTNYSKGIDPVLTHLLAK